MESATTKALRGAMVEHLKMYDSFSNLSDKMLDIAKECEDDTEAHLIIKFAKEFNHKARIQLDIANQAADALLGKE